MSNGVTDHIDKNMCCLFIWVMNLEMSKEYSDDNGDVYYIGEKIGDVLNNYGDDIGDI
jgi:hypothetical protein